MYVSISNNLLSFLVVCNRSILRQQKRQFSIDLAANIFFPEEDWFVSFSEDRHSNFNISIYNPKNATWESYDATAGELCYRQIDVAPPILNISCSKQITGRYVKVYTQNVLTLCEVEVFGSVVEYHDLTGWYLKVGVKIYRISDLQGV